MIKCFVLASAPPVPVDLITEITENLRLAERVITNRGILDSVLDAYGIHYKNREYIRGRLVIDKYGRDWRLIPNRVEVFCLNKEDISDEKLRSIMEELKKHGIQPLDEYIWGLLEEIKAEKKDE